MIWNYCRESLRAEYLNLVRKSEFKTLLSDSSDLSEPSRLSLYLGAVPASNLLIENGNRVIVFGMQKYYYLAMFLLERSYENLTLSMEIVV